MSRSRQAKGQGQVVAAERSVIVPDMKKVPHWPLNSQLSEDQVRELNNFKLEDLRNKLENWLEAVEGGAKNPRSQADRIAYDLDRPDIKDARKLVLEEMRRRAKMGR